MLQDLGPIIPAPHTANCVQTAALGACSCLLVEQEWHASMKHQGADVNVEHVRSRVEHVRSRV